MSDPRPQTRFGGIHRTDVQDSQVTDSRHVALSTRNPQVVGTGCPQQNTPTLETRATPGFSYLPGRRSQNPACDEGTDMPEATAPDPDRPTVADALAFVTAARDWLNQPASVEPEFDRMGSAVLMLDRADEILAAL